MLYLGKSYLMELTPIIGIMAAVFTTAANIPQAYNIIRERSAANLSVTTYFILLTGTLLWVWYGILNSDWPVIITNGITVLTTSVIIVLYFSSKRFIEKVHQKVLPQKVKREARKSKASK